MSQTPELPRYLHKRGEDSKLVKDEAAYDAAIADGWSISNQFEDESPVDAAPEAEAPADEPKKRGRKPRA